MADTILFSIYTFVWNVIHFQRGKAKFGDSWLEKKTIMVLLPSLNLKNIFLSISSFSLFYKLLFGILVVSWSLMLSNHTLISSFLRSLNSGIILVALCCIFASLSVSFL